MKTPPEILQCKTISKSRIFEIEQLHLRFSNGIETQYERLKSSSNGAVLIVPMLDNNTVLLIREYAAGVQRYELALPKGKVEDGENILDAADREIMEEVGYASNKLTHLTTLSIAPGYLSHETHIILAESLYECTEEGDEPEP
ncbi:MAG: ADP compounds hydrolase NudE, partial [Gammaproteobacteria bacterium]|nr:ADP compounds hydrolase NudE [Gammaproteobacteria bacterium]